ncbi:hypothetical protein HYV69_01505 [Candidatus Uhrbacteria bacterium]|nr:hypothetical protein [Candidatus Uhrbacteria bacterium]
MFDIASLLFSDSSVVLFGATLFVFGAILCLTLLLKQNPKPVRTLIVLLIILFFLLLGMVSLDLFGRRTVYAFENYASFSELLSTHRLLIIQLPFVLIVSSIVTLIVYGEKIANDHAKEYRYAIIASVWITFLTFLLIGLESML